MPVARRRIHTASGPLRTLFNVGAIGGMTDGQLLERFAAGGEAAELAFAALVERHGAVVLQVCRSILRDEHAAEDAFQATFLVLVRKSGSLWVRDSLSPWLHQVACRAARCARSAAARRSARERKAAGMLTGRHDRGSDVDVEGGDVSAAVHEEIGRLPERFRVPVVLCDLEGRTHEQAARHLGCPVGTVKSRLARGRARLRDRLTRRGLLLPGGRLAAGRRPPAASCVDATTAAAVRIAAGRPPAELVSAAVLAIVKAVSRGGLMNAVKGTALAALALGALAAGAGGWVRAEPRERPGEAGRQAAVGESPRNGNPAREARDGHDLRGRWDVLYVAGTVAGKREGYPTPNLVVPATDGTINIPALTGKPNDPLNYLGVMSYTLDPGVKEAEGQVESAGEHLDWVRLSMHRTGKIAREKNPNPASSTKAKAEFDAAEAALQDAMVRRNERKAEGRARESRIDMEGGPGGGRALRGIYRLNGDVLTICYDDADRGRPETFADNTPSACLLILRRARLAPARPQGGPLPPPTGPNAGTPR